MPPRNFRGPNPPDSATNKSRRHLQHLDFVPQFHSPSPSLAAPTAATPPNRGDTEEYVGNPCELDHHLASWWKVSKGNKLYCNGQSVLVILYCRATKRLLFARKAADPGYFHLLKISAITNKDVRTAMENGTNIVMNGEYDFYQGDNPNCMVVSDAKKRLYSFSWRPLPSADHQDTTAAEKWHPIGGHDLTVSTVGACAINEVLEETGLDISPNLSSQTQVKAVKFTMKSAEKLTFFALYVEVSDQAHLEAIAKTVNENIQSSRAVVVEARRLIEDNSKTSEGDESQHDVNKKCAKKIHDFFASEKTTERMKVRDLELDEVRVLTLDEAIDKVKLLPNPCPLSALSYMRDHVLK